MLGKILISSALATLLLACAPFSATGAPPLSPEQRALNEGQRETVAETCDRVMGLHSGGVYRQDCMDSLARSVSARAEGAQMAGSYDACRQQGLREGTAAFSTCMLDRRGQGAPAAGEADRLAYDSSSPENSRSYFSVNNRARWRREQYSCAQIGLTPGTSAFGQCVASLDASLMPNPF